MLREILTKPRERLPNHCSVSHPVFASLAISGRFTAQVRGLGQAVRNANDGMSMLQTTEGAMQEVTTLLQRMREISVQASNDIYSESDRASLQDEIDQLSSEIDRIASATDFNGINFLDGTGGNRSFQVGANSNQSITVSLTSIKARDLNLNGFSMLGELNGGRIGDGAIVKDMITLNGVVLNTNCGASATAKETWLNTFTSQTGVTAKAYNSYNRGQVEQIIIIPIKLM